MIRSIAGALLSAALATGCAREAPPRAIAAVKLIVIPAGRGSAQVEYYQGGRVIGGHFSGDSVPFVHQDEGRLDSTVVDSLWALTRALGDTLLARSDRADSAWRGHTILQVDFEPGPSALIMWPLGGEHADPRVRAVTAWALAHRIGGW